MVSGVILLDGPSVAGGPGSVYDAMGGFYAADYACDEARNEGFYVGQGCAIVASGTAGKVDMSAGTILVGTVEVAVTAVTAASTTITTLASGLSSGQALWVALEVDTAGALNFNAGSAAAVTTTGGPLKPSPTSNRVVVAWLYVPFGATAVDALTTTSNAKAKILEARRIVPGVSPTGWQYDQNTWVFASATTFTIAGIDATGYLKPGTRISYNDGAVDYGVIASVAFSTNTTVTLITTADYSIANATLVRPRYSYVASPQGFPTWFGYTATYSGWSTTPAATIKWATTGRSITLLFTATQVGTSTSVTHTTTIPVAASSLMDTYTIIRNVDNGAVAAGFALIALSATTMQTMALATSTNTASGSSYYYGQITYHF